MPAHPAQSFYASQLLRTVTIGLGHASAIETVAEVISGTAGSRRILSSAHVWNALWAVTSLAAFAFPCGAAGPWATEPGQCVNQYALVLASGGLNVTTDLGIMVIPVMKVAPLKMSRQGRLAIIGLFSFRIL